MSSNWKKMGDKLLGKEASEDCFGDWAMCFALHRERYNKCKRKKECRERSIEICFELIAPSSK